METFVQNIAQVKSHYNRQVTESRIYRGRIPKKKRIRNKIQKKRENEKLSKFYLDEFHQISKY
ncbi:hypothetical protein KJB62_10785 [Staphylococcus saprophyticus]|uniref:hypothetical protein n=1 Tax=Staphylococcus saprophyticus TaxID=29385 RepID=UPI001F426FC8|nr:hypothetical protein [Staphylococcus saprophyticus]MCE5131876.1 hypothetical protein [Staphylococcus saprophyticus]